jgi:hypothetical protein
VIDPRNVAAVLRHPSLWREAARLVPPRWWARWPPLPLPPAGYASFRTETMYGRAGKLEPEDLVAYLKWCRSMGRGAR